MESEMSEIYARKCIVKGCERIAHIYSDYCFLHKKENKEKLDDGKEIKNTNEWKK